MIVELTKLEVGKATSYRHHNGPTGGGCKRQTVNVIPD